MKRKLLLLITAMLFSTVTIFAQGGTTGPLTWNLSGGTLTISVTSGSTGAMPNYEWGAAPWYEYGEFINTVVMETGVTTIGNHAFLYCTDMLSVTIPNGITTIGNYAFGNCASLSSITIPNSATTINSHAFYDCASLTSITIPNSVITINDYAFGSCASLTSINVESGNSAYTSENGVLFNKNKTTILCYPAGKIGGMYVIPNSVTSIGNGSFGHCMNLTSITIPNTVTSIGGWAFFYCKSLTSIIIPNGVTIIGAYAFGYCSGLREFSNERSSPQTINSYVFDGVNKVLCKLRVPAQSVSIYKSTEVWKDFLFIGVQGEEFNCTESVPFGSNLNWKICPDGRLTISGIGEMPNYDYYSPAPWASYSNDIIMAEISNNVTTIGNCVFQNCSSLTSITIPNSITTIGELAFSGCPSLTSITIPNGVTSIGDYAFQSCGLTSLTIPNGVISIGSNAFMYCNSLQTVNFNAISCTTASVLFYHCPAFTTLNIGNGITHIPDYAFSYCSSLNLITNFNSIPIEINATVFQDINQSECTLIVIRTSVLYYQNAAVWQNFNIVADKYDIRVNVNNTSYGTVTGSGMYDYNTIATITATANEGHKFVNWTKDGVEISTDTAYSFTVTEDVELVANFEEEVGIENIEFAAIKIYPNPTAGKLRIESGLRIENVIIYDVFGKTQKIEKSETAIDISHLPAGLYFVKISTEVGEVTRKVLKE